MDRFAHTDAAYLIADSILGELTFVRQALEAAGCERIYISGDEAEALALIERERIDLLSPTAKNGMKLSDQRSPFSFKMDSPHRLQSQFPHR